MKKTIILLLVCLPALAWTQTAEDLFKTNDVKISWLGVDFSHVKLIGCFSHFHGFGEKNARQIKHDYFPEWNSIILHEREKYDVRGMLRKDDIFYDIDMIGSVNQKALLEDLEAYNTPHYALEDIKKFVEVYNFEGKTGIGIVLIAETLNKAENEAYFHFVAINMKTREILVHQRVRGEPSGMGMRNYWANAIDNVIRQIERNYYRTWRAEYARG
jgi:hypothetical protein